MRWARIRTWAADSSPDTYSTRVPPRAALAATSSSRVDLPTPGSPASSSTAPGTIPPPSTRSSSAHAARRATRRCRPATCAIGTAGLVTGPGLDLDDRCGAELADAAPGLALAAAADPLHRRPAALDAAVGVGGAAGGGFAACQHARRATPTEPRGLARSCTAQYVPSAEHDRVVDLGAAMLGEDQVGLVGGELDPHHRLEVGARLEHPADVAAGSPASRARRRTCSTAQRVVRREAIGENQRPNVLRVASLSMMTASATGPHHPVQLAQARLAARAEEVRPPGMRESTERSATGSACAEPCRTSTFGYAAVRGAAPARHRSACGSTPTTCAASAAKRGRWKPVPQPMSRMSAPDHGCSRRISASITPSGSTALFSSS